MSKGSVFSTNRTQNVRIPADMRFPETVKSVTVRSIGKELILSPVENTWDSFFMSSQCVTDDFMVIRAEQKESEREAF